MTSSPSVSHRPEASCSRCCLPSWRPSEQGWWQPQYLLAWSSEPETWRLSATPCREGRHGQKSGYWQPSQAIVSTTSSIVKGESWWDWRLPGCPQWSVEVGSPGPGPQHSPWTLWGRARPRSWGQCSQHPPVVLKCQNASRTCVVLKTYSPLW